MKINKVNENKMVKWKSECKKIDKTNVNKTLK